MTRKVLVIDRQETNCRLMKTILEREGFESFSTPSVASGIKLAEKLQPDVVILDLALPMTGLEVIEKMKSINGSAAIVVITNHPEIKTAIRTAQLEASDFVTKPIDQKELLAVVQRALNEKILREEVAELRQTLAQGDSLADELGPSLQSRDVLEQIRNAAPTNYTVLLVGETGTGKEVVARAIFERSERRKKPFIAIDCGAIPEALLESELFGHEKGAFSGADRKKMGQFQLADGGTILLDEIGNLPLPLQAKFLRVLESKYFHHLGAAKLNHMDVRFLAATNYDLQDRINKGLFRADLYFRLAQYTISLSPLRERPDDIPYLAQRFLEEVRIELHRPVMRISPDAEKALQQYDWPGNIRELKNAIRYAVLKTKALEIDREALNGLLNKKSTAQPNNFFPSLGKSLKQASDDAANVAEKELICESLRHSKGNKSEAARQLKTDFKTLHLKMKSMGIRAVDFMP